jgi:hypothetical protein
MKSFFESRDFRVCVLKHDGLFLWRNDRRGDFPKHELRMCEESVKDAVGITVTLVEKSLQPSHEDEDLYFGQKSMGSMKTPLERIAYACVRTAMESNLKRLDGHVLKPHRTIPGVFIAGADMREFANNVSIKSYLPIPNMDKFEAWFQTTDHPRFPLLFRKSFNDSAISFRDGYMDINALTFHKWVDTKEVPTTRHYFDVDFPTRDNCETPLWDKILMAQLAYQEGGETNTELVDALEELIGRCFYPIGLYDNWQQCPMIIGDANTGKSSIIDVVRSMFP